jgi:hypothetical protein
MPTNQKKIEISFISDDEFISFNESKALKNYLRDVDISDEIEVKPVRESLKSDEAGGDLLSILSIVANAPVVSYLIQSLTAWIKSRANNKKASAANLKFKIKTQKGDELTLDINNIGDNETEIINNLVAILNK